MLEKDIESKVCSYAKAQGMLAEKFKTPNKKAVPDRIFSGNGGLVFFIEFKATRKAKTIHSNATGHEGAQWRDHQRRRKLGHRVYVIDSIEAGKRAINFETTGDAAWLSDQSSGFQPVQCPDDAVVGHGPGEDSGSPDEHS